MAIEYVIEDRTGVVARDIDRDEAIRKARQVRPYQDLFCALFIDGKERGGSFVNPTPF